MTHEVSAITSGKASREFNGKLNPGMTSRMLPRKMKKNRVDRKASHPRPSGPIICITIWLRTKSIPASRISWSLPKKRRRGTTSACRKAPRNSRMNTTKTTVSRKETKL